MESILVVIEPELDAPWVLDAAAELARETGGQMTLLAADDVESQRFSSLPRSEIVENARLPVERAADRLREGACPRAPRFAQAGQRTPCWKPPTPSTPR